MQPWPIGSLSISAWHRPKHKPRKTLDVTPYVTKTAGSSMPFKNSSSPAEIIANISPSGLLKYQDPSSKEKLVCSLISCFVAPSHLPKFNSCRRSSKIGCSTISAGAPPVGAPFVSMANLYAPDTDLVDSKSFHHVAKYTVLDDQTLPQSK